MPGLSGRGAMPPPSSRTRTESAVKARRDVDASAAAGHGIGMEHDVRRGLADGELRRMSVVGSPLRLAARCRSPRPDGGDLRGLRQI